MFGYTALSKRFVKVNRTRRLIDGWKEYWHTRYIIDRFQEVTSRKFAPFVRLIIRGIGQASTYYYGRLNGAYLRLVAFFFVENSPLDNFISTVTI